MTELHLTDYKNQPTYGATRDGFGQGLLEAAQENHQIVGLCADLTESTRMNYFKEAFPERFIEVGVAEENLLGLAAGFALAGKIPFAASYAAFGLYNAFGVLRTTVCYSNLNVKLIGGHAGLSIGQDGATHQALEDLALARVLPNLTVVVPCDLEEARKATHALAAHRGPAYLRTTKYETLTITSKETAFKLGKALVLKPGEDATIIACGTMVAEALLAAETLEKQGISTQVMNLHTIKPLDTQAILKAAQTTRAIVTVEEHQVHGGLGGAVAEVLAQSRTATTLTIMGVQDQFGESGTPQELLEKHGLTQAQIVATVKAALKT